MQNKWTKWMAISSLVAATTVCQADPAPFGMALGKMSVMEFTKQFKSEYKGVNKYSNGDMFDVPAESLNFDGLQSVTAIFDDHEKLVAVLTEFPKSRFSTLNSMMKSKYHLVRQNIPFVGDTSAVYRDGKTDITLDAPHMSFTMTVNYVNEHFQKAYDRIQTQEQQAKKKRESNQL